MTLGLLFWTLLTGSRLKGLLFEGRRLLRNQDYTRALGHFREVVARWPGAIEGYRGLHQVYLAMGLVEEAKRESAIADSMQNLKKNPNDVESLTILVRQLAAKEMYGQALPHLERLLGLAAENRQALRLGMLIYRQNRLYEKAMDAARRSLALDPLDPELYEQLAYCLKATDRPADATRVAKLAKVLKEVEQDPASPELLEAAISQLSELKRRSLALPLVERALAKQPGQAHLHSLHGEFLLEADRREEAREALLKAVELDATQGKAQALLAEIYQQEGNPERQEWHRRLADLMAESRRAGDKVASQSLQVEVLWRAGQWVAALHKAEELERAYPQDWRSHLALGRVHGEQGRVKEALQCFFKASQLNDRTPEPLMAVARMHGAGGQVKEAVAYARQAVSLAPRDPAMRHQMADFLTGLGLKDLAREERQLAEVLEKAYRDPLD